MAREFARNFNAANWGFILGILHDAGKCKLEFQERIRGKKLRVDHSISGAKWVVEKSGIYKPYAKMLAYCILGHHTGIPNGFSGTEDSCLIARLEKKEAVDNLPNFTLPELEMPRFVIDAMEKGQNGSPNIPSGFSATFFTRFLFSCLKDADCLDTEAYLDEEKNSKRGGYPPLNELKSKFDSFIRMEFSGTITSAINEQRNKIQRKCLSAAAELPGLFSLTVPTGGGKTLSSLAFAFSHASKHGFERIIYVIPYTSIIEQTAAIFKEIFGKDNVIEHHSNYGNSVDEKSENEAELKRMLATENWDAPIIVTTNVQFFESLFNNRTSRLRKIHNIARSVVIMDEAQMLPVPFLKPTIEAIKDLAKHYSTSCVLCTATQPALNDIDFSGGFTQVKEIVADSDEFESVFTRVKASYIGNVKDIDLISRITNHPQVLCIVNTRNHARLLFTLLRESEGCYHLSALMCPEHRTRIIKQIKNRLAEKLNCKVISTQLIEAGVDVDFPVVYRSIAGLDSIVQSAGRCNREGKLVQMGKVFIFYPETGLPSGPFKQPAQITMNILDAYPDKIMEGETIRKYFKELFWIKNLGSSLDEKRILDDCKAGELDFNFPFKDISKRYRLIEDIMEPIIIPFDENAIELIDRLREEPSAFLLRKLQRYTVGVYTNQFAYLKSEGFIETLFDSYHVISSVRLEEVYNEKLGLNPKCNEFLKPENIIL